jgi:hypothetical protein
MLSCIKPCSKRKVRREGEEKRRQKQKPSSALTTGMAREEERATPT